MLTDPIADMLTRIRNALQSRHEVVEVPFSKIKLEILKILEKEGYVRKSDLISDGSKSKILVQLKYQINQEPVISSLHKVSRPGRRVYVGCEEIRPVFGGYGLSVLSTSKGVLSDKQAKEAKVGGELLCTVW